VLHKSVPSPSDEQGVPLDRLLLLIERAIHGDPNLQMQLIETMRQLANHPTAPREERALGDVLTGILIGNREPDLSKLPPDAAEEVGRLLERLSSAQNEA
jgi:hypothetical protein